MKKYIIIGASQGIGRKISELLINKYELILCSRNISKVKKYFSKKKVFFLKFDANNQNDINKLVKFTKLKFGKIDGIVLCQGMIGDPEYIYNYNIETWSRIFNLNFKSNLVIIRKIFKLIRKNKFSKIIFFSGGGAFNSWEKFSAYSVAKTALVRFSENLAAETKRFKIMVNCIAPGFIKTNIHKDNYKNFRKLEKKYMLVLKANRKIKPDYTKVLGLFNFLIKTKNMNLTGKTISANFDKWNKKNFISKLNKDKKNLSLIRKNIGN